MDNYRYTNPIDAMDAFDNLPSLGRNNSIEEFLDLCSFDIQEEIRPILEMITLFKDYSRKAPQDYFESL